MREPSRALDKTLKRLCVELSAVTEDWWLIGSAALAVHGVRVANVADVDVLTTPLGAAQLAERWGAAPISPGPSDRFRSDLFLRWIDAPLPVEVMAGLHLNTPRGWQAIWPRSRVGVAWRGATCFTPSRAELLEILELFDRPKDRERAAALRALSAGR